MASQAIQGGQDVCAVFGIDQIRNWMSLHGMAQPVFEWQNWGSRHVVFRQLDLAVKDRYQMLILELLRMAVGSMALEAELVGRAGPQQVNIVVAVRLVADGASLLESGLVNIMFLALLGLVGVAAEADGDRIGLGEGRRAPGVRIVAIRAVAGGSRMLDFGFFDLLRFIGVARDTQLFGAGLCEHNFAVFRRLMANIALL